jgi:hypothetical protein
VGFLLPGRYSVRVQLGGFKRAERVGIPLQTADSKLIDIVLEIGDI